MRDREAFLRAFHAAHPGITARAFGRAGTYERLAARVRELAPDGDLLDLACGDGRLTRLLGPRTTGLDLSIDELARGDGSRVQGRAQDLPFADASFAGAACHLAFMLFDDIERVVGELGRVLRPGAPFVALLGGGPVADGRDAFHVFAERVPRTHALGDRRASTEAGWRELFAGWRRLEPFERWELDLGGTFDDVWSFLGASYQLPAEAAPEIRAAVRAEFPGDRVPCRVAVYVATVRR